MVAPTYSQGCIVAKHTEFSVRDPEFSGRSSRMLKPYDILTCEASHVSSPPHARSLRVRSNRRPSITRSLQERSMSNHSETFGRLLKGAVGSIAAYEGKAAQAVEDELGAQIGVAGSAIQRYKA